MKFILNETAKDGKFAIIQLRIDGRPGGVTIAEVLHRETGMYIVECLNKLNPPPVVVSGEDYIKRQGG